MNAWWTYSEVLGRMAGSLLHFLWQGALIAFVSAILLRLLARRSAASRYAVAVVCLGLMVLAPCVTFIFYAETGGAALRVLQFLNRSAAEAGKSAGAAGVAVWTAWIVSAWAVGVSICGIRLLVGWILSRGLIRSARVTVPEVMSQLMERIRTNVVGSRRVRFLIGERVDSPVVFGWIRPVVLLPVAAVTGLSENQLLAVLAHELAHIRRHDFLVNALQRGVESVLFYHPAVWWLSSRIRTEREHCCDDLAVQVCGDRFVYAEALIELERARATVPALAIPAAAGNLGERVRRVLGISSVNREWQPAVAALLLVAVCALAGSWQTETIAATSLTVLPPAPARVESPIENPVTAIAAIVTAQTEEVATPAPTQSSKGPLEGVWQGAEILGADASNTPNPQPGLFIFTRTHYGYMYVPGNQARTLFKTKNPTDPEKIAAFDSLVGNTGTYETSGTTLTIRPIVARFPNCMDGGFMTYQFRVEGNTLFLTQKYADRNCKIGQQAVPETIPAPEIRLKLTRVE